MEATPQAASPHETAGIRPPRATRRPVLSLKGVVVSLLGIGVFEVALVILLPRLLDGYGWMLGMVGLGPIETQPFIRGDTPVVDFATWLPSENALVAVVALATLVSLAALYVRRLAPMVRGAIIAEAGLLAVAAMFMLATGRAPYEHDAFVSLYAETTVITWLVLPFLLGLVSLSVPFLVWERLALIALVLAHEVVLSAVRFGLFGEAFEAGSALLMAPLFLNFGPLLDFMGAIAIFSFMLVRVSARLEQGDPRKVWSWS